jgi:uncharacterized protein (DUF2141 family)
MIGSGWRHSSGVVVRGLVAGLLLGLLGGAPAVAQQRGEIRVKVVGLQSDQGALRWALYNKKEGFATEDGPIAKGVRPIKGGASEFVIPDLPYGSYAVLVGHDVNGDGKIDRSPFSPELKGISNYNAKIRWFPDFDKARFRLDQASLAVTIHVY